MKILIVGSVASGKSTLARKLSKDSNIRVYEIDSIVHDDVLNVKRSNLEQQKIINEINKNKSWILEGTLRSNLYNLLDLADIIIYVDTPVYKRKIRIFNRFIKQKLGIEKCNYKPNINMLKNMYKWTNEFEIKKDKLYDLISKKSNKFIHLFDNKINYSEIRGKYEK